MKVNKMFKLVSKYIKMINKKNRILIIVSIIIIIVFLIIFNISKLKLSTYLLKDWKYVGMKEDATIYEYELDFSKKSVKYSYISEYSLEKNQIYEKKYKIITPSKIKIQNQIYKIKFNEDKTIMTISPKLTKEEQEKWISISN